jgi:hypothetical protein
MVSAIAASLKSRSAKDYIVFRGRYTKRGAVFSGSLALWQDPDADLRRSNADDEGENDRGLTATDTKT